MARISLDDWKKKNGREQGTGSAAPSINTQQPTQARSNKISLNDWQNAGKPSLIQRSSSNYPYSKPVQKRPDIWGIVNDYATNSVKAFNTGNYNPGVWNKQYKDISDYLDQYGDQMNHTEVAMLRTKLNKAFEVTHPNYTEITGAKLGSGKPIVTDINDIKNSQKPISTQNALQNKTGFKAMQTPVTDRMQQNEAALRELDYYLSKGYPLDQYSNRELQSINRMNQNLLDSRYKTVDTLTHPVTGSTLDVQKDLRADSNVYAMDQGRQVSNQANLHTYMNDAEIKEFSKIRGEKDQREYLEIIGLNPNIIDEIIESLPSLQEQETKTDPLSYKDDKRRVDMTTTNINAELKDREWQGKYATTYLNEDFDVNKNYDKQFGWEGTIPEVGNQAARGALGGSLSDDEYDRMLYEAINGNQAATDYLTKVKGEMGETLQYDYGEWQYMDPDNPIAVIQNMQPEEVGMFNYLYKTQGKEAAMEYYEGLKEHALHARTSAAIAEEIKQKTEQDPLGTNILAILAKPATDLGAMFTQLYDWASTGTINANDPKYQTLNMPNLVRDTTSQMIMDAAGGEGTFGADALNLLYQSGVSALDNVYGTFLGGQIAKTFGLTGEMANRVNEAFTLTVMSSGAAQTATLEGLRDGLAPEEAVINGMASGLIEYMTEKIGMDNFFNSFGMGKSAWIGFAKQALAEGSEEVLSNISNDVWGMMFDAATGRDVSKWRREMNAYILENGLAPSQQSEAFNAVFSQHMKDTALAFASGTASAIGLGGIGTVQNHFATTNAINDWSLDIYGRPYDIKTMSNHELQEMADMGMSYAEDTKAYKLGENMAIKLQAGEGISVGEARRLYNEIAKIDMGLVPGTAPDPAIDIHDLAVSAAERNFRHQQQQETINAAIDEAVENGANPGTIDREIKHYVEDSAPITDEILNALSKETLGQLNTIAEERAQERPDKVQGAEYSGWNTRLPWSVQGPHPTMEEQNDLPLREEPNGLRIGQLEDPGLTESGEETLVNRIARNYENEGRNTIANVIRTLSKSRDIPADVFINEMIQEYDAGVRGEPSAVATNPETGEPVLTRSYRITPGMAAAAYTAGQMDQMQKNGTRIQSETGDTIAKPKTVSKAEAQTKEKQESATYTPVQKKRTQIKEDAAFVRTFVESMETENRAIAFGETAKENYKDDMDAQLYVWGANEIYQQASEGKSLNEIEVPEEAAPYISNAAKTALYNAAVEDIQNLEEEKQAAKYQPIEKTPSQEREDQVAVTEYADVMAEEKGATNYAQVVKEQYQDDMDPYGFTWAADQIYNQAADGVGLSDIELDEDVAPYIGARTKAALYYAAVDDIQDNGGTIHAETEQGNVPVPGSSERINSQSTGIESQRVASRTGQTESTGSITEGDRGSEEAYRGTDERINTGAETTSNGRYSYHPTGQVATAKSLGIETGTDQYQVQIVELDDTPEGREVYDIAKSNNKNIVLFAGNNLSIEGQKYGSNGVIQGDTIYVRADHPYYTPAQIALHEVTHPYFETDANGKINSIIERLDSIFDPGFVREHVLPAYRKAYKRTDSGDLQTLIEVMCDVRGGMNIFHSMQALLPATQEHYDQFLKEGQKIVSEAVESIQEADQVAKESNAPPAKYSLEPYSDTQIKNWSNSKKIILYNNNSQLLSFVEQAKNDPTFVKKIYFGTVGQELADLIYRNTRKKLFGRNVTLRADHVRKTFKDHGNIVKEKKKKQRIIESNDFTYIPIIVGDPEFIGNTVYNGKPAVVMSKKIGNDYISLIMVDSGGSLDLFVQTMYAGKKRSIAQVDAEQAANNTSETTLGTASNNNLPQPSNAGNQNLSEEMADYENITPQSVTETHSPSEIENAKTSFNDVAFSLEFAPDIQERQRKKLEETKAFDIDTVFQDAIDITNKMVQRMVQYKDILPADKVGKVLVKNGSYDYSVENTTICLRTLAYNQFVDMVQDKLNRPLTQMESFLVSQKLYDIAVDPQCLYCYVSLDRKAYNEFLNRYIEDRDEAIKRYEAAGKPSINSITMNSPLFVEFLHGRKATGNMLARYRSWIQAYNNGEHLLTKSDIKTDMKRAAITQNGSATEKAQLKDILAYAQSASWSKKQMDYVAYNGEILKMGKPTINKLNSHYGLRFYSFSDYSGAFIVENMQQVMDASIRGLKGLAYTKDVDFARIFADTGMNINISVFAKFNPETEQYEIDPLQSANLEDAIALRNEKKNVGIVVVATDTDGVRWAMHQDWSDVVIPFHTVRTGKDVADFYDWTVFTGSQNDTVNPAKQNLWDAYVKSTGKKESKVSKMIYPNEHQNDYDTYMKLINDRGLTPRFDEFRFDENGNVDPTYMKLVNETRQSAGDTQPMIPKFNLAAAEESFQKFVDKGGYYGGWYNEGVNVDAEAQKVANDIAAGKTAKDVEYGRQDVNYEDVAKSRKTNRQHARFSMELDIDSVRYSQEPGNLDVQFEAVMEDAGADLRDRVSKLEADNRLLTQRYEYFKGQTQLSALTKGSTAWQNVKPVISPNQARRIASTLIKSFSSGINANDIAADIQYWVTYLATKRGGEHTFDDVNRGILPIAKKLVENAQAVINSDGSRILQDIRNTKIMISPRTAGNITDYNEWRKAHMGKMTVSTSSGTDITEYYNQLTQQWGESVFPSDILNAEDQLMFIADFVDSFQPISQNPYSYDMAGATQAAALELYNEMLNANIFKPTFADKSAARMEKLVTENRQRIQNIREQAQKQKDEQIQKLKDHYKEMVKNRRARKEESTARQKLLKLAKRMQNMKTTNANRALIDSLIGDLDTIAMSLSSGKAQNLLELNAWYEDQKQNNPDFVAHESMIQKQLARLTQKHIKDMTLDEVKQLTDALMTLENDIRNKNQLIGIEDQRNILEMGMQVMRDIENSRGIPKGKRRSIDNIFVQGTLSPVRFMHRLTGYVESDPLYQAVAGENGLAGGQRKMLDYQYRAGRLFEQWLTNKELMKRITGKKAEILTYDVVTADGQHKQIQMTPAMRMELYLASKDQGWMRHMCGVDNPDGSHTAGGGIVLPDINAYKKGNLTGAYDSGTTKVKITKSFLNQLANEMSADERAFADAIHDYFNGMSKDEINAVSELLVGRSIAEVGDYLPISVDKNFLGPEYGAIKFDGTIEGMGNLKERQNSNKPVIVRDITDVLKQSIESTSKYVGLAIPIRNFNRLMGVTIGHFDENGNYQNFEGSVLESIANKWGGKAQKYIEKMISDLQVANNSQEDIEKLFSRIRSKYAGAVLTLNLSVAMKQAASYPTAAAVLGWTPLIQAFAHPGHVDLEFIAKWTPLQWYRTQGFSTSELGDIKNQNNIFANLPKGLNWIQGVDLLTTRKLWKASEIYVRNNRPDLYRKGAGERGQSDEFYKEVANIYNQVIEETQPNYTPLQRPDLLRSKSGLMQTLMMFKTQPFQNFNVLYDAIGNFRGKRSQFKLNSTDAQTQAEYKEAGRKLRNAITSQIGQLVVFAAMTMLWNMLRRKKEKYTDEEGNISMEVIGENVGKDILSGVFSMVPFGADAYSLISSLAFGDQYYGFESVTDSALGDLGNAVQTAWKTAEDILTSDEPFNITTYKKKFKTVISAASKVLGIPFDNLYNLATMGNARYHDIKDNWFNGMPNLADYWALSWAEDPSSKKNEFYNILYKAFESGNTEEYETIRDLMIASGEYATDSQTDEESIDKGIKGVFIKQVSGGTAEQGAYEHLYNMKDSPDYEKERQFMIDLGFDEEKIDKGMQAAYAAELTGTGGSTTEVYDYMYQQYTEDPNEFKTQLKDLLDNGYDEDTIRSGIKTAYAKAITDQNGDGKITLADVYVYLYDLYKKDKTGFRQAYQEMIDVGFTEKQIKDGVEEVMKAEKGVASVKDLKTRFEGPSYKTPTWWTVKDKDTKSSKPKKTETKKTEPKKEEPVKESVSTPESSWIRGIDYDEATQTLVVYTNSGSYVHTGVSKDTYEDFKNSPSKGRWYNAHF